MVHYGRECCCMGRSAASLSLLPLLACQDYQRQMKKLDGGIEEVNGWIDGAEKKMNEMDGQGPNDAGLKVLTFTFIYNVYNVTCFCHTIF